MRIDRLRIAITGCNGQLGQELRWLAPLFQDMEFSFYTKTEWDIAVASVCEHMIASTLPDVVINAAAYTNVEKAEEDSESAFAVNTHGPGYLAAACKKHGALLIHVSTDYVFDGRKRTPYSEEDEVNPLNEYGRSKLNGERAIDAVSDRYFIIRTSWLYSTYGHNFYKTMVRLGQERDSLSVVNDQIASPTYARFLGEDVLHLIRLKLLDQKPIPYGIYHYTQQEETSWYGFAQEIMRVNQLSIPVQAVSSAQFPTKATRPQYSKLSTEKWENNIAISLRPWQAGVEACRRDS